MVEGQDKERYEKQIGYQSLIWFRQFTVFRTWSRTGLKEIFLVPAGARDGTRNGTSARENIYGVFKQNFGTTNKEGQRPFWPPIDTVWVPFGPRLFGRVDN